MRVELYNYEVYPIGFLTGVEKVITIKPMNEKTFFEAGHEYSIEILETIVAAENRFAGTGNPKRTRLVPDEDGCLRLHWTFPEESMYQIRLRYAEGDRDMLGEFRVYALAEDMRGKYPYMGDLHMHTCRSDGRDGPAVVAANYRAHGYDFTVISDHHRYCPSLEARKKYSIGLNDESPITDLLIVQGEEVHLPYNDVHYINFGGKFSINALVTDTNAATYGSDAPEGRSLNGDCPPVLTREEYDKIIRERAAKVDRPLETERMSFAVATWVYEMVQKAGGLGIFPHPYWLTPSMQLSEDYTRYFYMKKPFDAFEVLGGESYYQHNGFQTGFYYEMKARGYDYPVVGSTDSHGSTELNRNAFICSTIVFTEENKTQSIIRSIKSKYSVAVDSISAEYRLVGDFRWMKYGSFLMENWFPIHDLACRAEGYYMRQYAFGNPDAEGILKALKGQLPKMLHKFFEMD